MKKWTAAIASYLNKRWYERFVSLFTATIMMTCLSIFENYWWPESFKVGYATLILAVLIDFLLPIKERVLRWIIQFVFAVVATFRFARMEWEVAPPEGVEDFGWWLKQTLAGLHPFIWIALAVWLIHLLFSEWAITRSRMFGFIGAAILILAIADSFTPIWLWDNVAVVVFTGLIWLVLNHLDKLKRTHPDSWRGLLEYPIRVITPALIVLSIFFVIALNVPSISPLLQDPYTIWKNARGEEVRVFLGEKALDNERDIPVRNASSGYSRNDDVLGGGFDYDFSPMMTVSTSQRSYWRGESKDLYTGSGWVESDPDISGYLVRQGEGLAGGTGRELAETAQVNQIVTLLREDAYPILFGAAPISRVNWIGGEESSFPAGMIWSPDKWELSWVEGEQYPDIYSVTSSIIALDEDALRNAKAKLPDAGLNQMYLQLPNTLPPRVQQLASEIAAGGTNDYDKAKLLESYLKLNFTYSNKPDLSKLTGDTQDFVDQFLFELKEGYCDYFSTALAIMARSLDMPARWVKGFSPGVLPSDRYGPAGSGMLDGEDFNPQGAGTYTVRNSDAHSWVEIYFEGYGWIPFEPTSGFTFPYMTPDNEEIALPELDALETNTKPEASKDSAAGNGVWGWAAFSLLCLSAGAWLILNWRKVIGVWRNMRQGSYSANELIVKDTNRLLRACRKKGLQREEHETLREAFSRWSQSHKRLKDDFRMVLEGFEGAKYGAENATKEEAERFSSKVRYLIEELK